jgi:hypothetical protein
VKRQDLGRDVQTGRERTCRALERMDCRALIEGRTREPQIDVDRRAGGRGHALRENVPGVVPEGDPRELEVSGQSRQDLAAAAQTARHELIDRRGRGRPRGRIAGRVRVRRHGARAAVAPRLRRAACRRLRALRERGQNDDQQDDAERGGRHAARGEAHPPARPHDPRQYRCSCRARFGLRAASASAARLTAGSNVAAATRHTRERAPDPGLPPNSKGSQGCWESAGQSATST